MKKHADEALLHLLKRRFDEHPERHEGITWARVRARLEEKPQAWPVLAAMESTGGEPDVIGHDKASGEVIWCDCAAESPAGRRSLNYDLDALNARKENKPKGCVVETARELGVELLTEAQYRRLQELGEFDTKTSSWIATPPDIRRLGGALFCDRRYGQVFTYHNGAESYYASRGFRGQLRV